MHLVPAGVVNATSSPNGVLVPPRNATWKSAASTGPAACTHSMASLTVAPGAGAAVAVVVELDVAVVLVGADAVACRDGEMGVSLPVPGVSVDEEPPATSSPTAQKAAKTTVPRIRPG